MSVIISKLTTTGQDFSNFFQTPQILYIIYFIAFFFTCFILLNTALQRLKQFQGKPAKVIATMISIMVVGAIFYGDGGRSPEKLILLFNSFGGFILILFLGLVFIGAGIAAYYLWYFKLDEKSRKISHSVAMLYLALGVYIGTSLLIPHFPQPITTGTVSHYKVTSYTTGYQIMEGTYLSQLQNKGLFNIFGDVLGIANSIALLTLIVCLFILVFKLFNGEDSPIKKTHSQETEEDRKKHISDYKKLLNNLLTEMRHINDLFTDKVNLLNEMKRRNGGL